MGIIGVHHVTVKVLDLDRAVDFYTNVLGLAPRSDWPGDPAAGATFDAGAQQVHLGTGDVPGALGQHFALDVADLDDFIAELRGKGLVIRDPSTSPISRQTFVSDSEGNDIELREGVGAP